MTDLRERVIASAPRWYSPYAHLALTTLLGLAPVALGIALIDDVRAWQLGFGAGVLVLASLVEWLAHRYVLHRRVRFLGVLYDEHTPEHHAIFLTDDMAIRDLSEARLVLIPSSGIAAILAVLSPLPLALYFAGQPSLAGIVVIVGAAYVLAYEWIHLAAHLPDGAVTTFAPLRFLRRHHAIHHHPTRMMRCNFNVALPLVDALAGTLRVSRDPSRSRT